MVSSLIIFLLLWFLKSEENAAILQRKFASKIQICWKDKLINNSSTIRNQALVVLRDCTAVVFLLSSDGTLPVDYRQLYIQSSLGLF